MSAAQIVGVLLLALPFVGVTVLMAIEVGWGWALLTWGLVIVLTVPIAVGAGLLMGELS